MAEDEDPHEAAETARASRLPSGTEERCVWCTAVLSEGATVCPSCGASVTDPALTLPDADPPVAEPAAVQPSAEPVVPPPDLPAEAEEQPTRPGMSYDELEQRRLETWIWIGIALIVCAVLGWLLGPLLSGPVESMTGVPVEDTDDLRPTGLFIGVLFGFLFGGIAGMVTWANSK